jgi:hypothetical protein
MTIHSQTSKHLFLTIAALALLACGGVEDPGEGGGPDAGNQVDPPDAADPDETPDAEPGECPYGYTGPDCADCIDEYQDVDGDGVCKPSCEATGSIALNCGDFGECAVDDTTGDRFCECSEGHEGAFCDTCAEGYEKDANDRCVPWEPSTTGMALWLDADQASSLLIGNGNGVSSWQDRRGGSHPTLTQPTVSARPVYVAVGMNDRPVIRFNGSSSLVLTSFDGMKGADYTVFLVFGPPDNGTETTIFRTANLEHGTTFHFERISTGLKYRASHSAPYGTPGADTVTSSAVDNLDRLFIINRTTSGLLKYLRLFTNRGGEIDGDDILNAQLTQTEISLGHRLYLGDLSLNGDIAELIIYDRHLDQTEMGEVRDYLAAKWNIQ